MASLVRVRDAVRRFGERVALDGVSLDVDAGELVALVGGNGAGKSSLLRAVAGRVRLDRGQVAVDGLAPAEPAARRRLGFTPQDPALFPHLTVRENVEVFAGLSGLPRRQAVAAAAAAIARVGLEAQRDVRAHALSGGMRKRASLAAGVAHGPAVVLADEPVAGVDLASRDGVHALLRAARDGGAAVVMATHDLEGAEQVADRVVVLQGGRIKADASPAALVRGALDGARPVRVALHAAVEPARLAAVGLRATPDPCAFTGEVAHAGALAALLEALAADGVRVRESRLREPDLRGALDRLLGEEIA